MRGIARTAGIARYIITGFLILIALPTFAVAGEAFKDVIVRNTVEQPIPVQGVGSQQIEGAVEISNLPETQKITGTVRLADHVAGIRSGNGYAMRGPGGDVLLPDDILLTDLVLTLISSPTGRCEVALFEDPGVGDLQSVVGFYLTDDDRTEQLHLESGLLPRAGWGVAVNGDCVVQVFWTGHALP